MRVKLSYFKSTGKWYADSSYDSSEPNLYEIWAEVQKMKERRGLPGLHAGHLDFTVLINVPGYEHVAPPHLLIGTE